MQYKTIVLRLLQQHPEIHEQLRERRTLLPAMEFYAQELKARHEAWKQGLSRKRQGSDPSQIASEALELALAGLQARLRENFSTDDEERLSLDTAMAFISSHTPSG